MKKPEGYKMKASKKIKNKISKYTYDKVELNSKIVTIKRSFDEVSKLISGKNDK
ncbi:hypothetical protein [Lachnotalea glycerini]|uniref:hypothetical protein n=1 Tax=Lachnotalea glycerini TaxID=1763509 RepID=UPI001475FF39|nr:hypothetical protein [Lachnotalea glycerini]